jgi:flagella basal body P-ring formation protein FlgA
MKRRCAIALIAGLFAGGATLQLHADDLIRPGASVLTLKSRTLASGPNVTFRDVLDLDQADPRLTAEIADAVIETTAATTGGACVTHDRVVARLKELGVNMARVLVRGAATCNVNFAPGAAPSAAAVAERVDALPSSARSAGRLRLAADVQNPSVATGLPAGQSPAGHVHADAPLISLFRGRSAPPSDDTLEALLRKRIADGMLELGGRPEIEFESAGRDLLALRNPPYEFTMQSPDRHKLGVREFTVTIRRDGQAQRSVRVAARVRLVKTVAVAAKPLNPGTYIRPDDLRLEPRVFERAADAGYEALGQLMGQQVAAFVPAGRMLRRDDVKSVDMVSRSQRVTVVEREGGIQMTLVGTALDAGALGDRVRVRLGETRDQRRIVHGIVMGFGSVSLSDAHRPSSTHSGETP